MALPEVYAVAMDYNGTLVMDAQKGWKVFCAVCAEKKEPSPSFKEFRELYSSGPFASNLLAHGVPGSFDELDERVRYHWSTFPPSRLAKGAWNTLIRLRTAGISLALITRLNPRYAGPSLRKRNLEQFFSPYIFLGVEDKRPVLRDLPFQGGPLRTLFLTDTVLDVREGKETGCIVGAFTRGYGLSNALQAAGADFLYDSWTDLFGCVEFKNIQNG